MNDADGDTDGLLVAYLDRELDAVALARVEQRLAADAALRIRLEALRAGQRPFWQSFERILAEAPVSTLETMLAGLHATRDQTSGAVNRHRRGFFAGVAAAAASFGLGLGTAQIAGRLLGHGGELRSDAEFRSNWRQRVAEYQSLYTPEGIASIPDDDEARRKELEILGAKLGLALWPEAVSFEGLTFKRAQLFGYDGRTLGQITYLHAGDGQVVALCIVDDGQSDTPIGSETREGMDVTYWSKAGRSFMFIGMMPTADLRSLALDANHRL